MRSQLTPITCGFSSWLRVKRGIYNDINELRPANDIWEV